MSPKHISVLLDELVEHTRIYKNKKNVIVDATLGFGGHASQILKKLDKNDVFIGFDADETNLQAAEARLRNEGHEADMYFVHDNFGNLSRALKNIGIEEITAIYYDFGLSSMHLDEAERGFSFMHDGPLDMRLDKSHGKTASDIVNGYTKDELRSLFLKYGEEAKSALIAAKIVEERRKSKFRSTGELAEVVGFGPKVKSKIFQALRIEVNDELKNIESSLEQAVALLQSGGSIFAISFHSLEDRIVKHFFKKESRDCICSDIVCSCHHKKTLKIQTKKPLLPSATEVQENPRSRSAKARCAIKI